MFHLQSSQIASQIHPGTISNPSRFQYVRQTSIVVLLNEIQVTIFLSRLHPWTVSIKVHNFASLLHRGCISIQSILAPIHIKVSASARSCLTSIQVLIFASHFHPGDASPPSMFGKMHLSYTHVLSQTHTGPLHLHPGPHLHPGQKVFISSRSLYRLTSTHITYHILSVHEVCSSSPPMSSLNSIQSP